MIERVSSPISDDISNGQGLVEGEQEEITILSDSDDTPPCSPPKKKTKLGGDNQIQDRKVSMNNIQTCHEDCDTNFKQIENSDVEENKIKCLNISGTQNFKLNQNTDVNFKEAPIGSQCNTQNNQINVKSPFIIESEDSLESILSKDAESIESLSQEKSSQDIATDYSPKHLDSSYVDLFDSSLSTILSTEDPEETSNRTLQGMSSSEKNSELKTSDRTLRQLSSSEKTSKLEVHTDTTLTPLKGYNGGSRSSRLVARKVFEKDSENKIIPQIVTCSAKDKSSSVSLVAVDDEVEIIGENLQEPSCHSVMTNDDEISVIDDNLHEFSHTQQPSPTFSLSKEKKYKFTKSKTKQSHLLSDSFFQNPKVLCGQSKDQDVISASINEHDSCESQFQKSGYCDVLSKRNNEQESHLDQSDGKPNVSFSIDKTETFRDVQHSMDISPSTSQNSDQSLRENVIEIGHSPTQNSDVWEGFDDSGMGACLIQCDTPVTSPKSDVLTEKKNKNESLSITESQKNPTSCLRSPPEHSNGEDQIQTIESCYSQIKNESQTTKVNYSQIQNQSQTNFDDSFGEDSFSVEVYKDTEKEKKQEGSTTETFKTPVLSKKSPTKKWIPPSPFTPMPEYDKMNTPLLKQEVQKIGVKPVGKKRMLMLLKDVYHQTHQYETDSEFETSVDELNNLPDINSMEEKEASADEGNISSSQESEKSDVLEESVMRISDDEFSSSQTTTEADIEGLHGKISKFIHQRKDIYTKILMYEPLDLDWLKKEITESGTKCSMDKLMNYLDEKCITFTLKNRRKASPKKRRGRGKKKLAESK